MLVAARSRSAGALPGCPLAVTTLAPGIFPLMAPRGEDEGTSLIWVLSTTPTLNVAFFCDVASEVPVTTTSSRLSTSFSSTKSCCTRPAASVTGSRFGLYPMYRAMTLALRPAFPATSIVNV